MSLSSGTRLGHYEVRTPLGAGGMGEVYRARDTRLGRDVALKILPDAFADDPERLARFEREATTLAALNHPHIAHIHGVEESGSTRALVMELVEGDDLAQRLVRGALPVDEAVPIARQIADALEAAHGAGIIHRDLKPANIKVRPDGTVKVLDFGLAKALDTTAGIGSDRGHSPTITSPAAMTHAGVILGTAAYMAPEQARGKAVDPRADIWAFGCVLYEMLAGRRAFGGDDLPDTLTAIMRDMPAWNALPADTPPAVRAVLERCLEIYARDARGGGQRQITTTGAEEPRWSADGRRLYFRSGSRMMSVDFVAGPTLDASAAPALLFDAVYELRVESIATYDVDDKTSRFLMVWIAEDALRPDAIRVVLGWRSELRRALGLDR